VLLVFVAGGVAEVGALVLLVAAEVLVLPVLLVLLVLLAGL
jgi:hypothetical protein